MIAERSTWGHLIFAIQACLICCSCTKTDAKVQEPQPFLVEAPSYFPTVPLFPDNPLTKEGVALGRLLFYDTRLSGNNTLSCASCHHPEKAFSDGIALTAIGASGTALHRHAPALINMAWANNGLFWDGGSTNLESQAFGPLTAGDEMHQDLVTLVDELNQVPDYVNRFSFVFKDDIKVNYIIMALAQFERTLVSAGSKYDAYLQHKQGIQLSWQEQQGLQIVEQKCAGCHEGALFTDNDYHNNGIDSDFRNAELEGIYKGRARITYNDADLGKFKTPTLRNVMVTAPYMHDGRFATIEAVLDHYAHSVKDSPTLDSLLQINGQEKGIKLTEEEKQAVIAFLNTLTDNNFLTNPDFDKPQ
jgi:cytochrome c peroxidase